jgi:hypothetical protein
MLASIPLTDDERAAVDDGQTALDKLLEQLVDVLPQAALPHGRSERQLRQPCSRSSASRKHRHDR